jgi:type I restriction enzyme M protein
LKDFLKVDLHSNKVKNDQMGLVFENLIRRFNELANETAGDHFTPREVIHLMVDLLFMEDNDLLRLPGTVRTMLDPACGTGGMLAEAQSYMRRHNAAAKLYVYGQDYNKRAFATAASDMLMKQVDHNGGGENIQFGDTFTEDRFEGRQFDYFIANPPFGVDWKKQQKEIQRESEKLGFRGRFGAGLPRVNDGSLLFLQHMISKFEDVDPKAQKYGSRAAIVFSGSPLFTGGAGGGESEIRHWIIERDMLEAIVALPEQMFYNTGIGTYIWLVTNRKAKERKGKIQLVDAREIFISMRRCQGDRRRKIGEGPALEGGDRADEPDQIADIVRLYGRLEANEKSKLFDNADFGYTRVTVERPLRLRYQMSVEDKARFLDAAPHLLDDIQAIDKTLGREPQFVWNAVRAGIEKLLRKRGSRWKAPEERLFRTVFTLRDPKGAAVRRGSGFEADADLRDFENVPLDVGRLFATEGTHRSVVPPRPRVFVAITFPLFPIGREPLTTGAPPCGASLAAFALGSSPQRRAAFEGALGNARSPRRVPMPPALDGRRRRSAGRRDEAYCRGRPQSPAKAGQPQAAAPHPPGPMPQGIGAGSPPVFAGAATSESRCSSSLPEQAGQVGVSPPRTSVENSRSQERHR